MVNRLLIFAATVIMCGLSFICYLLNQLHLDLKNLQSSDGKSLKGFAVKERQGTFFSILIIIAVIIFIILSFLYFKNLRSTV